MGTDANGTGGTLFARQAFMLVRNFLVPNLSVKAGRQLVVWGNHRMMGHFDWNNVGWSHDGLTAELKLDNTATLQVGWLRAAESNCSNATSGICSGGRNQATGDADLIYVRVPMNVGGLVLEPTWIWHSGGTNEGKRIEDGRPANQSRHTVGGRAFKKGTVGSAVMDATIEGYYQFGEIGGWNDPRGRHMDISAHAFHLDAGVTLPVAMQPRSGRRIQYRVRAEKREHLPGAARSSRSAGCRAMRKHVVRVRSIVPHQPHPLRVHGPDVVEEHEASFLRAPTAAHQGQPL